MKTRINKRGLVPLKAGFISPEAGFTLVEMLVVIAILGILMAMMVPAAGLIMKRAAKARARGDAGLATTVLLKYQAEYNRWPGAYLPAGAGRTDADWVAMMGPKPGSGTVPLNPKRIVFFEPGGGALSTNGVHAGAFVDPWGNPFWFRVDLEGDGEIEHPDPVGVGGVIRARVVAWSGGPDGDDPAVTWADNVTSWE